MNNLLKHLDPILLYPKYDNILADKNEDNNISFGK